MVTLPLHTTVDFNTRSYGYGCRVFSNDTFVVGGQCNPRKDKITFFRKEKAITCHIAWFRMDDKYRREQTVRTWTGTRFETVRTVTYYQCKSLPTYDELVDDHAPAYV